MSATFLPSLDTIRRSVATEIAYTLSRLQVLEKIPGNPIGVAHRSVGEAAVALMARHLPTPDFNRVANLRPGDRKYIAALVEWYREAGVKPRFEVVPGEGDEALARELARHGYFQSDFHASLIGDGAASQVAPGESVERVASPEMMDDYLEAYVAGWGIAEALRTQFKQNVRPWLETPGWTLYLARAEGCPAAAATLYVRDRVGYLADSATDPKYRGRGLHHALLLRRLKDAAAVGVDFVCSGAKFLSTSHRNMIRAGMQLQFVRAIWTPL
jgi:GNAT superfamily N-acetyltransferase